MEKKKDQRDYLVSADTQAVVSSKLTKLHMVQKSIGLNLVDPKFPIQGFRNPKIGLEEIEKL